MSPILTVMANASNHYINVQSTIQAANHDVVVTQTPKFSCFKTDFAELDTSDLETGSDVDDQDEWEELNDEQLLAVMSEMDNKLQDPDWLPKCLRKKAEICAKSKTESLAYLSSSETQDLCQIFYKSIRENCLKAPTLAPDRAAIAGPANIARHILSTMVAALASSNDEPEPTEIMDSDESTKEVEDVDNETWKDELMLSVGGDIMRFHDWSEMHENIKSDLKKNSNSLLLAQINKLTILSNFATLYIKGCSRIQASVEIARQWHEGKEIHFARKVQALVRHY
ncbi:hypothetical protein DEU56DRAFT_750616 [Suillus clintonianus]|uniref:uncharacterized protein n=1 Tax=Suillus clintonianus TaxID=1904413 RepID=UPI001B87AF2C|nr:uncharacterized protein DEU56DRAFT_750616 [Suillus clintonianus]KAG2157546.1 hypothetical protein DEU56DRAFT_750616 [Suillus clintonianus]